MSSYILGAGSGDTPSGSYDPAYWFLTQVTAPAGGTVTEVRLKLAIAGYAKVALYADSAGEPGARLAKQDTQQSCAIGWNTMALEAGYHVTTSGIYWLSLATDATATIDYKAGGAIRYKPCTLGSFTFPDPAGAGFYSGSQCCFLAGWGTSDVNLKDKMLLVF